MRISLAAVALTIVAVPLIWTGSNPFYAAGWAAFTAGVLAGLAGAVGALVRRDMPPWKRVAAFVLGAVPPAFAGLALYVVASMPYD